MGEGMGWDGMGEGMGWDGMGRYLASVGVVSINKGVMKGEISGGKER